MTLGVAPAMAKEHLLDISPDGFRFYIDLFPEIDHHDMYLLKDHGNFMLHGRSYRHCPPAASNSRDYSGLFSEGSRLFQDLQEFA
ncbi:hypothetical protein L6164_017728 [Bauhinia variegata]|uniref:Uncharacterized protein n=1 Tax=Bauhinia variegata TaxID=167791 RepID=A0ACB9N9K7_BAUVA|nr:hypothetical protein L6164_017728 [Bauhinia variegata]